MHRRDEINLELQRLARVAGGLQMRYRAHLDLHSAAAMARNKDELVQRRDDVHTVLDALLDNGEAIQTLIAELETLS